MGDRATSDDRRARRSDAEANRERVVDAAIRAIAEEGVRVPITTIAVTAGVGVATFYRSFADRDALMRELERRAYTQLNGILDGLERDGADGVDAIEAFLVATIEIGERLILPLHGAPPLLDADTVAARQRIDRLLEAFLDQGRGVGDIRSDVNATDVIMCSALITQPLRHGPDWDRSARRHVAVFVSGLGGSRPVPGPPVEQADLERAWRSASAAAPES